MRCKPLDFGGGYSPELIWTGGLRERERVHWAGLAFLAPEYLIMILI
jgi:hypothetical protein